MQLQVFFKIDATKIWQRTGLKSEQKLEKDKWMRLFSLKLNLPLY